MIGYRINHFVETRINLAGYFDAIGATAGIWCHDNEVEHTTPKALVEDRRRALDAIDHRSIWPPSQVGIRKQSASPFAVKVRMIAKYSMSVLGQNAKYSARADVFWSST